MLSTKFRGVENDAGMIHVCIKVARLFSRQVAPMWLGVIEIMEPPHSWPCSPVYATLRCPNE